MTDCLCAEQTKKQRQLPLSPSVISYPPRAGQLLFDHHAHLEVQGAVSYTPGSIAEELGLGEMGPITLPASRTQNDSHTTDKANETPIPAWQPFSLQSLGKLFSLIWPHVSP